MVTSLMDELRLAEQAAVLSMEEQLEKDDQDEWEYEYSTTETEVCTPSSCLVSPFIRYPPKE